MKHVEPVEVDIGISGTLVCEVRTRIDYTGKIKKGY